MNVREINPGSSGMLYQYVVASLLLTSWILIAFRGPFIPEHVGFVKRLAWPLYLIQMLLAIRRKNPSNHEEEPFPMDV